MIKIRTQPKGGIYMNYEEYNSDGLVSSGKINAYKNHLVKNIETIGQRKLAVIADDSDYALLARAMDALRKKNVRVPEIFCRAVLEEDKSDAEGGVVFIDELKGKSDTLYALVAMPYTESEKAVAAMSDIAGTSQQTAEALKDICGYSEKDICEMNDPEGSGLAGSMGAKKAVSALNAVGKRSNALMSSTMAKLSEYKGRMRGERCFVIGNSVKLDELNVILNERCIGYNNLCEQFSRTSQRPTYYLLTSPDAYLGNGKYIESMECFVNSDVNVFEDKFKKKPTYLAHFGKGLIDELPDFREILSSWETAPILPLYEMIELMMFMGFVEIYVYGFDGLFGLEYSGGVGRRTESAESEAGFPEKAAQVFEKLADYSAKNKVKIYSMCETKGLSCFEKKDFRDIDFTASSIFAKLD